MTEKIEQLKEELCREFRKECSDITVKVTFTINAYGGFYTQIEERTSEGLKLEGISMRNLKGEWISPKL